MTPADRLSALEQFGIKLGLDSIRALVEALGHPERAAPVLHVAGTNGKGSTAAMLDHALRAAGHATGRYTSPHLAHIEERFAVNGGPVASVVFNEVATIVLDTIDRLHRDGVLEELPTFFEATTAIAFEIFRRAGAGVAIVEVGLGGRFDATSVVSPLVTAITSIDRDHERFLGTTASSIAFEKAGIARTGVPLVTGRLEPEALATVREVCRQIGAPLVVAAEDVRIETTMTGGHATITVTSPVTAYPPIRLSLAGRHQADNALVAIRVLEAAAAAGLTVSTHAICTGLETAVWPARLEWVSSPAGRILFDAAHNPAGARALAAYLTETGHAPIALVLGVMEDKDVAGIASALAPIASLIVATQTDSPRALPAAALADVVRRAAPGVAVIVEPDPDAALARALTDAPAAAVGGSIFLVGPLRARWAAGCQAS